jgi:DNA polymerase-4
VRLFGKSGAYYYNVVRGIHHGEVKPNRIQKSVAVEHTFWDDINEDEELFSKLKILSEELEARLSKREIKGKTLTLKIKYKDFRNIPEVERKKYITKMLKIFLKLLKTLGTKTVITKPSDCWDYLFLTSTPKKKTNFCTTENPFEEF